MYSIAKSQLDVQPIDWTGLSKRFMNPGELEVLVALVRSVSPRAVIEFGCNEGRTAAALLREIPSIARYQGIDVLPGYVTAKPVQRREIAERPAWMVIDDPRFDLILRRRGSLDLTVGDLWPCDACFIDGDHGREAVLHDTSLARRLVRPGGIIVWHDYHDLGTVDVREVLDERAANGAPLTHVEDTWFVFERIPK